VLQEHGDEFVQCLGRRVLVADAFERQEPSAGDLRGQRLAVLERKSGSSVPWTTRVDARMSPRRPPTGGPSAATKWLVMLDATLRVLSRMPAASVRMAFSSSASAPAYARASSTR